MSRLVTTQPGRLALARGLFRTLAVMAVSALALAASVHLWRIAA